MTIRPDAVQIALNDLWRRSRNAEYLWNPVLWAEEVLGVFLWTKQKEMLMSLAENKRTAVKSAHSTGKALSVLTPILTTEGWSTMADILPGDYVYSEEGLPIRVTGKSPVWYEDTYRVTFSDGQTLVTNGVHEWNTIDFSSARNTRNRVSWTQDWRNHWDSSETRETQEIAGTLTSKNGASVSQNHLIPINRVVQYLHTTEIADLPVPPYVMGAWLGDGTSVRAEMTVGPGGEYIVGEFADQGYALDKTPGGKYRYTFARQGFREYTREVGLLGNKHITPEYLYASEEARWELLRGLMDTDGFHIGGAVCGIDLMNQQLSYGVVELVRSLGMRISITPSRTYLDGRDVGVRYRMLFNAPQSPFTAGQYKDDAFSLSEHNKSKGTARTIVSVEQIGTEPTVCIEVDSPRHLYLAGKALIPTHNSYTMGVAACWWVSTRPTESLVVSTAPTYGQVHAILWQEIRKHWMNAELPGDVTQGDMWNMAVKRADGKMNREMVAFGRRPADYNEQAFSGLHRVNGVLFLIDEACHDDQTEVLTEAGWKWFKDLTYADRLFTRDPQTEETSYAYPTSIIAKPYSGDMYYYEPQRGANFAVTPDHVMHYTTRKLKNSAVSDTWKTAEVQDMMLDNTHLSKTVRWSAPDIDTVTIPALQTERGYRPEITVDADDWFRLMGWFYSEGSINKRHYSVVITQKIEENRAEIISLCERLNLGHKVYPDSIQFHSKQLGEFLVQTGRTCDVKRLPAYIRHASPRQIELFLDTYVRGDGYLHAGQQVIYTSCKEMADDLQECVLKTGSVSRVVKRALLGKENTFPDGHVGTSRRDGYVVYRSKPTDIRMRAENMDVRHYEGTVYCATVPPNHTLLTRRNGAVLWSGNCGCPRMIFTAAEVNTTAANCRILAIANPDDAQTDFGEIFLKDDPTWNKMTISAYDTPNFTGEEVPEIVAANLPQIQWVEDMKIRWGEDSSRFKSKILAEFPDQSDFMFFTQKDIDVATDFDPSDNRYIRDGNERPVLGMDIARFGDDFTTVYARQGNMVEFIDKWGQEDLVESSNRITQIVKRLDAAELRLDGAGIGAGVIDYLAHSTEFPHHRCKVISMMGGGAAQDNFAHMNARAERHDELKKLIRDGSVKISSSAEELLDEMLAIRFTFNAKGAIQIESKQDMKSRGTKSPDHLDAVTYAVSDVSRLFGPKPGEKYTVSAQSYASSSDYEGVLGAFPW